MSTRFMILVVTGLLAWGAYWAALPWLDCWRPSFRLVGPLMVSYCTFGVGGTGALKEGLYPNVLVAVLYLAAAGWLGYRALRQGVRSRVKTDLFPEDRREET